MTTSLMDSAAPSLTVVIPCYNEAERLDEAPLLAFLDGCAEASLLFVDDGSTDATADRLAAIAAARPARIDVLSLRPNGGKAEAVRRGMLTALERGAGVVGYLDADLSTPPGEILRLRAAFERPGIEAVLGSRVALLGNGHRAERGPPLPRARLRQRGGGDPARARLRHAVRRQAVPCLAGLAGGAGDPVHLPLGVRRRAARAAPDRRRGRPRRCRSRAVVEVPLTTWHDVKGSKLSPVAMARSLVDLGRIGLDVAARRRRSRSGVNRGALGGAAAANLSPDRSAQPGAGADRARAGAHRGSPAPRPLTCATSTATWGSSRTTRCSGGRRSRGSSPSSSWPRCRRSRRSGSSSPSSASSASSSATGRASFTCCRSR